MPGTGSPLILDLHKLVGTHSKGLLPTDKLCDTIEFEERGSIEFSAVDLANYIVFEGGVLRVVRDRGSGRAVGQGADEEFERFRLAVGV